MSKWLRLPRHNDGQGLIEMAIVITLLLFLLVGVIDIGRAFNNYIVVTNSSREGARYGSRRPFDQPGIITTARAEAMKSNVPASDISVQVDCMTSGGGSVDCDNASAGDTVRVTTEYLFETILGAIIGKDDFVLRNMTEMVVVTTN